MVVLFFAVIWAAVLLHSYFRRRAESRSSDSIGSFLRHLSVLQRTAPALVQPANTLRLVEDSRFRAPDGTAVRGSAVGSSYGMANRALERNSDSDRGVSRWQSPDSYGNAAPHPGELGHPSQLGTLPYHHNRQRTSTVLARRRRTLVGLCAGTLLTAMIGIAPGFQVVWLMTALLAVALLAYMAMLVNLRNLAAERSAKLRYLPYASTGYAHDGYSDWAGDPQEGEWLAPLSSSASR
ncbi:MAG: hypothetical protein ACYDEY_03530 [Acidimicrobiales bacterium]